jgi:hypothetical protein
MALESLLGAKTNEEEVVGGRATGFATKAGFAAALTAIGGVVLGIVQEVDKSHVNTPVKVAAIGLVGLGALAWSIAATGDVLARAYASAHVVASTPETKSPIPVAQWALTETGGKQAPAQAVVEALKGKAASGEQPHSPPGTQVVPLPAVTSVSYKNGDFVALAIRFGAEKPDAISLLVTRPGESAKWVDGEDLAFGV